METDIHCCIQYSQYDNIWITVAKDVSLGRDYILYAKMYEGLHDLRIKGIKPRGLPIDFAIWYPKLEDIVGNHSYSWIAADEFIKIISDKRDDIDSKWPPETTAAMMYIAVLNAIYRRVRIVFGFDS